MHPTTFAVAAALALALSGCASAPSRVDASAGSTAPIAPVPTGSVTSTPLPPPGGASTSTPAAQPGQVPTRLNSSQMAPLPGVRETTVVPNVSRTSTSTSTTGGIFAGTIVGAQPAGSLPSVIDRNREPVAVRRTAPSDSLGPGTPPPANAVMREELGNTLRNRQRAEF